MESQQLAMCTLSIQEAAKKCKLLNAAVFLPPSKLNLLATHNRCHHKLKCHLSQIQETLLENTEGPVKTTSIDTGVDLESGISKDTNSKVMLPEDSTLAENSISVVSKDEIADNVGDLTSTTGQLIQIHSTCKRWH